MRIRFTILLIASLVILASCQPSTGSEFKHEPNISVEPKRSGTIQKEANKFRAEAEPGYFFTHWFIVSNGDTTISESRVLEADSDTLNSIRGNFRQMDIKPLDFATDPEEKTVYFINSYLVDNVDTAETRFYDEYYGIFKYQIDSGDIQEVWRTTDRLQFLNASSDGKYLAFTQYNTDAYPEYRAEKKVLSISNKTTELIGLGLQATWANTQQRFFTGTTNSLYIAGVNRLLPRQPLPSSIRNNVNSTDAYQYAAWSPNDQYIVFNNLSRPTYLYEPSTEEYQTIEGDLRAYHWVTPQSFLAVKNGDLYNYYTDSLDSPMPLGIQVQAYKQIDLSPDGQMLAHVQKDRNLYISSLDGTSSRLIVEQESNIIPEFPVWLSNELLLIHNRSGNLHLYNLANDNLEQL